MPKSINRLVGELLGIFVVVRFASWDIIHMRHHQYCKDIALEVRGAETELDKSIVERLVDPLTQMELNVPVLVCVCRRRAVDLSRHLVKGQHSVKDPLDPRAYHQGRLELVHLDGVPDGDGELDGEGDHQLEATIFDKESANPTAKIISTISLAAWMATLTNEDLALISLRVQGFTLTEIADEVGSRSP